MDKLYIVSAAAGAAAVIVGSFFCVCQLYRLVQVDAECRGLKHPKLWGLFGVSGTEEFSVLSMTEEQRSAIAGHKRRFGVGLSFLAVGAIVCVLSMFLSGQF